MFGWFRRKKSTDTKAGDNIDYMADILPDAATDLPPDSSPAGVATDRLVADTHSDSPEGRLKRITTLAGGEH